MTAFERLRDRRIGYPASVALVLATIGLLKLLRHPADSTVALVLLLAVFLSAWVWESGAGTVAAIAATVGFNFFFLPPMYTLTIEDPRNVAALVVFLVSGLLIGRLSSISRERLRLVEAERSDLARLTRLSQAFLSDTNRESLLGVAASRLQEALVARHVSILLAGDKGELTSAAATSDEKIREDLAELAYRQGNSAAFPSDPGGTDIYLPIPVGVQRAGVLVARGLLSSERMAEGCAVLLGLALERERFLRIARAAEETKTSDQMKSTLLAALAHDLKTPVAAARGAVENWAAESPPSESSRLAVEQLQTLTRRIGELMEVVRLDSGIARPQREVVGAAEIVEAAIARFGDALEKHALFVDSAPAYALVEADPAQMTEAFGHGLENAARYSPTGAEIRVSIEADAGNVFLRIADRGEGVPAEERERVFERFVRLDAARGVPGTGLGLSIARSLVELNGGSLKLSQAPGAGTLFEIRLPRVEQ
ncbi:MAG TPA: ATP-binding protein [Thermoanaerobaculia bacterium]|nr:ATP-binding protein [Thermoanaerobaculia bacterium]